MKRQKDGIGSGNIELPPAVDFGLSADDYGRFRQGFPPKFFTHLDTLSLCTPGQDVLDVGTGTGLLARALSLRGCRVTGLDPSKELLSEAKKADEAVGVSSVYHLGQVEATGLGDNAYDVVTAATCWHWFDRPKAAVECRRLLRREGRLLIAHLDWISIPGNVIDTTLRVIDQFSPTDEVGFTTFQYPGWLSELVDAGFDAWNIFGFSTTLSYTHSAWRGRIRASARIGPKMSLETIDEFDTALSTELTERFTQETLTVDHRVFAIVLWTRLRNA